VRIREEDTNKTTFRTRYDHYEFVVVPFVLKNAPDNFVCIMNGVFLDYFEKIVIIFLDDILIYSKIEEDHEKYLWMVIRVMRENQLYANISKCTFYQTQIHYLGHVVSEEGIAMDTENIEAIKSCLAPNNVLEVRSFMGLAGCYRRFIESFSKVENPITSLQNKGTKFE
jgi:hypothetical protein